VVIIDYNMTIESYYISKLLLVIPCYIMTIGDYFIINYYCILYVTLS
jgi:hypothetical protein